MDLRTVIEAEILAEINSAQQKQSDAEATIRSAFMRGMVLGAKLQTIVKEPGREEGEGWCAMKEPA
jgi:hypothetical protein